jgi:hypothetical protein
MRNLNLDFDQKPPTMIQKKADEIAQIQKQGIIRHKREDPRPKVREVLEDEDIFIEKHP